VNEVSSRGEVTGFRCGTPLSQAVSENWQIRSQEIDFSGDTWRLHLEPSGYEFNDETVRAEGV